MDMSKLDGFLPFIATEQYSSFVLACDYVLQTRKIALIYGAFGAGKSWAALQYIRSQPRMVANGRYPYHYMHLSQGEKTDRSFLNALIASIKGGPRPKLYAGEAMDEARRLWEKFDYQMLLIDEVWALQQTGIEAVRTFHDSGPDKLRIPVVLITVPFVKTRLEDPKYGAFQSRVGRVLCFDKLNKEQVRDILLIFPKTSPLTYRVEQTDSDTILEPMYLGAGGGVKAKASFRLIDDILAYCDICLKIKIVEHRRLIAEKPDAVAPPKPCFDVTLITE